MIDVSIIIVNYNTCEVTKNCINSIFEYTKDIKFEVILVDNNSQDESKSLFSQDKRINYIYLTSNLGFGKANNVGYEQAKGKYLFLLNSDTLLRSNAVKEFNDFMESSSPSIAFTGTMLKDIKNNIIHSYGNFPTLLTGFRWYSILGIILNKLGYIESQDLAVTDKQVDYITGADLFIRKDVINKYGLFDPDFFMYFEETELQYRYTHYGYKCYIYSTPKIIHLENYSMNKSYKNYLRKLSVSLPSYYLYLKKCKGTMIYYIFRIIYALVSLLWIIYPKCSLESKLNMIKKAYN